MKAKLPNEEARKAMMKVARSKKNPNNSFFISMETGEIKAIQYREQNAYFPSFPTGTYEIHITKEPFLSYDMLDEIIGAQMWGVREQERMDEEVA